MKTLLFEDTHIYVDKTTGDYYKYDGEKLVKIGGSPKIGDRGNSELQDAEELHRPSLWRKSPSQARRHADPGRCFHRHRREELPQALRRCRRPEFHSGR